MRQAHVMKDIGGDITASDHQRIEQFEHAVHDRFPRNAFHIEPISLQDGVERDHFVLEGGQKAWLGRFRFERMLKQEGIEGNCVINGRHGDLEVPSHYQLNA